MTAFDELQKHYRRRDLTARQWKNNGGQVVGYFCDNVPEEFILTAGLFPLRLSGDPLGDTEKSAFIQNRETCFPERALWLPCCT
jgi:hypothetical protein